MEELWPRCVYTRSRVDSVLQAVPELRLELRAKGRNWGNVRGLSVSCGNG